MGSPGSCRGSSSAMPSFSRPPHARKRDAEGEGHAGERTRQGAAPLGRQWASQHTMLHRSMHQGWRINARHDNRAPMFNPLLFSLALTAADPPPARPTPSASFATPTATVSASPIRWRRRALPGWTASCAHGRPTPRRRWRAPRRHATAPGGCATIALPARCRAARDRRPERDDPQLAGAAEQDRPAVRPARAQEAGPRRPLPPRDLRQFPGPPARHARRAEQLLPCAGRCGAQPARGGAAARHSTYAALMSEPCPSP